MEREGCQAARAGCVGAEGGGRCAPPLGPGTVLGDIHGGNWEWPYIGDRVEDRVGNCNSGGELLSSVPYPVCADACCVAGGTCGRCGGGGAPRCGPRRPATAARWRSSRANRRMAWWWRRRQVRRCSCPKPSELAAVAAGSSKRAAWYDGRCMPGLFKLLGGASEGPDGR